MDLSILTKENPNYSKKAILITLTSRNLFLVNGNYTLKKYPIAIGKPTTPTPTGTYKVIEKIVNPGGMLGTRWLGLNIPNGPYGIHGTWNRQSIGKAVSHGCIRLYNEHVEELFKLVHIGTTVFIKEIREST